MRRLPVTLAALEEGRIDFPRALAVVEQTYVLDDCAAAKVEQAVVPRSTGRPMPTLRRRLRREVLRADRKAAARRAEEERAHRKVVFRPVQDGMAELLAILPAEVARAIYATLTRVARGECGDERTMDARRADVLGALVLGDRALFDPGAGVDEDVAGGPADATDPDSASPAGSRDASPEDASSTGTPGRGHESDEPMGHAGETGAPMDRARAGAQADGAGAQADGDAGGSESNSATSAGTTPAGAGTGRMRTGPGRPRWPAPTTIVQVTVGAGTLLGLDDEPGELAGYGPIPAPLARRLAADATWRRILTDANGLVTATDPVRYRPGVILGDYVRTRDQVCRFPTCNAPAIDCDLDHRVPFPKGKTVPENLEPLCRCHRRLKTHTTWRVEKLPDNTVLWISPAGHSYTDPLYDPKPPPSTGAGGRPALLTRRQRRYSRSSDCQFGE